MATRSPFDYVEAIYQNKDILTDDDTPSGYVPFIVNRALSYQRDCMFYAQEMNERYWLPADMQNTYFINTVRAKKRYATKWYKKEKSEIVDMLKEYYGYSDTKAREALKILSESDISKITILNDKGGIHDRKPSRGKAKEA